MQIERYFASLSTELDSLKNRVRYLIEDRHWQTDGEWKESVLRTFLQRSAPTTVSIGRGFIVEREQCSTQIDVLIYDNSHPVLYRDGDLVFISPSACRGIIEVKTSLTNGQFRGVADTLAANAALARGRGFKQRTVFVGLFIYEEASRINVLDQLAEAADGNYKRIIDHVSIGESRFVKFWTRNPADNRPPYQSWHDYELRQMAQGYFIHNFLVEIAPEGDARRDSSWFPEQGKEQHRHRDLVFVGLIPPRDRTLSAARRRPFLGQA